MLELWSAYGFYLWGITTALVLIALAWLAWNTFAAQPEPEAAGEEAGSGTAELAQAARVAALAEAMPLMQATLGRTLQFFGLVRYADPAGAQAFALAVANARGDGFVLSSSVRGGLSAKPLSGWASWARSPLSAEEQSAVEQAREQLEMGQKV
jgi:hypothetical protein